MAHYQITRTLPSGWQIRLEFVSWDGSFLASPTELPEVVLTEVGTLKTEFDSLPIGMMNPMTFDFKIIWNQLPLALQNYLEEGYGIVSGNTRRNTWYLSSDRGTNGATWTMEFAGVEDNVEALELEALPNGMYSYSVELVDIAYFQMKTTTGWDLYRTGFSYPSNSWRSCWQIYFEDPTLSTRQQEFEFWSIDASGQFILLQTVIDQIRVAVNPLFFGLTHASTSFDFNQVLKTIPTHAVTFYRQDSYSALPRSSTTTIPANYLYVIGDIVTGDQSIGGLISPSDQFGWGNKNITVYDLLRSLAEQSFIRLGYRFQRTGTGGSTSIRLIWDVKQITESRDNGTASATPDQTLNLDQSLMLSNVIVRGDNILKAETRYETTSDKDATQIVKIQKGARASRSFNFEPLLINMPVDVQDNSTSDNLPRLKAPCKQTNQIFFNCGDTGMGSPNQAMIKVHEKTKVQWGSGGTDFLIVDPVGLHYPVFAEKFAKDAKIRARYYIEINDCQVNGGISGGITSALITVFANEKNAIIEAEWIVSQNTKVLADFICGRYTLTGNITTTFTSLNWTRAIPVSMEWDVMNDTVKHKYMLVK